MSQTLYKIQQVCAHTHEVMKMQSSEFTLALDECVLLAFTKLIGGELKETNDAFYHKVMREVEDPLCRAYLAYHRGSSRPLPYKQYAKFMDAVHSCGHFVNNTKMQVVVQETEEKYTTGGESGGRGGGATETGGKGIKEFLARLRSLLTEFETED